MVLLDVMPHTIYTRNNMGQKREGNCGLWVLSEFVKKNVLKIWKKLWEPFGSYLLNSTAIQSISTQIGLDWLCYLAGNSQTAPTIFLKFLGYFLLFH